MKRLKSKDGQAIVELVIGLVSILVVTMGMVQLAAIVLAHTRTLQTARREVGTMSVQETGLMASPDYIRLWNAGADDRTYSADDRFDDADGARFKSDIAEKAAPDSEGWTVLENAPGRVMADLRGSAKPVDELGLMRGADSERVPLISTIQSLLYRSEDIRIETEVWMVWTKGIY